MQGPLALYPRTRGWQQLLRGGVQMSGQTEKPAKGEGRTRAQGRSNWGAKAQRYGIVYFRFGKLLLVIHEIVLHLENIL